MSKNHKLKVQAREARQERQAKKVVGGIIIALLILAILGSITYVVIAR